MQRSQYDIRKICKIHKKMKYERTYIENISYHLPDKVVTSDEIENILTPAYKRFKIPKGQLYLWTGIKERRIWDTNYSMGEASFEAAKKSFKESNVSPDDIGMVIYSGVCRDYLEPAIASYVANKLKINENAQLFDITNACLGVLNSIIQVANAIETKQIKAGLIVASESSRHIINQTIAKLLEENDIEVFKKSIATLTGGSGAISLILTDESIASKKRKLKGYALQNACIHNNLCVWGPKQGLLGETISDINTDSVNVMKYGITLAKKTFEQFKTKLKTNEEKIDKIICHQVGSVHQKKVLEALNINAKKDFVTFEKLGNIGTVSLPITAKIAEESGFLKNGDSVAFFGIGSGLNCIMMGIDW